MSLVFSRSGHWYVSNSDVNSDFLMQFYALYLRFIRVNLLRIITYNTKEEKHMPEYLVLLKVNPAALADTIEAIRKMAQKPVAGVDLQYSINIFGRWDAGLWIKADENSQTSELVQKIRKEINGVTDIYPIPTFPHGTTDST
jgi:ACT domain-containing protein